MPTPTSLHDDADDGTYASRPRKVYSGSALCPWIQDTDLAHFDVYVFYWYAYTTQPS